MTKGLHAFYKHWQSFAATHTACDMPTQVNRFFCLHTLYYALTLEALQHLYTQGAAIATYRDNKKRSSQILACYGSAQFIRALEADDAAREALIGLTTYIRNHPNTLAFGWDGHSTGEDAQLLAFLTNRYAHPRAKGVLLLFFHAHRNIFTWAAMGRLELVVYVNELLRRCVEVMEGNR